MKKRMQNRRDEYENSEKHDDRMEERERGMKE